MGGFRVQPIPYNPPDPLDTISRLSALRNAGQQYQMQQVELEQKRQAKKDLDATTAAYKAWDGKDPSALADLVIKNGGSANARIGIEKGMLALREQYSVIAKNDAETGASNLKTLKDKNDLALGAIDAAKQVPDEQLADHLGATIQSLTQNGTLDQQHAQAGVQLVQAVKSGQMDAKTARQQLDLYEKGLQGRSSLIEQTFKESETRKQNAEAAKLEQETKYTAGPSAEGRYRFVLSRLAAKLPVSQEDLDFARGFEASNAKTTTQSDSLGVTSTNTSRPSGLAIVGGRPAPVGGAPSTPKAGGGATPQSTSDSLVDSIGQYKYNPTLLNRLAVKHPEILAKVTQKYPDWSQSNYNAINKAITDLAPSGKTGQQITSYNTFLRHAGALYDAVDSLDNSKYSDLLNKPLNWLAQHTGDARVADFMAAMQPPMKEFQSFLLNNHAMHEEDVKDAHSLIDVNKTPQEIRAVLKRFAETGSARLSEQNESFKRITGRDIPNLVSPEAAKAYNKITGQGGNSSGHVIQLNGKQYRYKGTGDTADIKNYDPI